MTTHLPIEHVTSEIRVSTLVGDRLCATCGYNLTGQAVLREPHYQMLIVRCPECATVASLQEYPLLGRWANRWAAVLSGVWIMFLIIMWIGSGAAIFGISVGSSYTAAEMYSQVLSTEYFDWKQRLPQSSSTTTAATVSGVDDFETWWATDDAARYRESVDGWADRVDWRALWIWVPLCLVSFIFGCFWATALIAQNVRGRLLWGLAVVLVACAFSSIVYIEWLTGDTYRWSSSVAEREIATVFLPMSLTAAAVALSAGLILGRSITRTLLCIFLPPRLRGPFSSLWLCDGLNPPIPGEGRFLPRRMDYDS